MDRRGFLLVWAATATAGWMARLPFGIGHGLAARLTAWADCQRLIAALGRDSVVAMYDARVGAVKAPPGSPKLHWHSTNHGAVLLADRVLRAEDLPIVHAYVGRFVRDTMR
jgi:hypothetical protein